MKKAHKYVELMEIYRCRNCGKRYDDLEDCEGCCVECEHEYKYFEDDLERFLIKCSDCDEILHTVVYDADEFISYLIKNKERPKFVELFVNGED